ncbi:Kiwa anti-phage protein KwaB-like domain-containing protein [Rathayibacter sp. AY1B5]|uniref:Kiwa anti-phage protein KwaB-like domain-containing protein n=1 Tax=Rathayibacter sp. AY1B5 TaxID=2080530 RepID=UPI0015E3D913|nr:Kiwa anti-phage protein KwaB-like domain-containing protein [Rathayibacter sp. AY1B5]
MVDHASFSEIDVTSSITLSVGWISGQKTKVRQVAISQSVGSAFREVILRTISDIEERELQDWAPDADLSPETCLVLRLADVGTAPQMGAEHGDLVLLEALRLAETLPQITPKELPAGDLSFYAITLGSGAGNRTVFLRRSNPRRGLKRGRIYSLMTDALQRIEAPIFAFDEWFDLVVLGSDLYILSQTVFAAIFRSQDALVSQVPQWTGDLNKSLAIETAGRDRLSTRAQRDSRIRARLEAVVRRGHLDTVPKEALIEAMREADLNPDVLLNPEGAFVMNEEDIAPVLYFLNEDLFAGPLTKTRFRADKKAAR